MVNYTDEKLNEIEERASLAIDRIHERDHVEAIYILDETIPELIAEIRRLRAVVKNYQHELTEEK